MSEQITVIGNIVNSPERRQTGAGDTVVNFRVATSRRRFDEATRSWIDGHTNFFDVSGYRRLAEHALASLGKGQRVIVTGTLRVREWETGEKRGRAVEIDATAIGPDLKWGTAKFTRTRHEEQGPTDDTDLDSIVDADPGDAQAPERELVGAGGWGTPTALDEDETAPY